MKRVTVFLLAFMLVISTLNISRASASGYSDVPSSHGFYKEIMFLMDKGVVSSSATFGVNQKVTREEVAVMVSKAIGLDGAKTTTPFKDVPQSLSSSGYINSAVKAGVLQGYTDGTFRPKQLVTRGQMAIFIANAFNLEVESPMTFKDLSPNMSSYSAVKKIVDALITTGYADKTFRPNDSLTRGQISAFISRGMQRPGFEPISSPGVSGVGTVKGSVTWQYNDFIGTKPDVGAKVFLIPNGFKHTNFTDLNLFTMIGSIPKLSNLHYAKVDGFGYYELNDVPAGDYTIIITSKNTTRNPDSDIMVKLVLEKLLGPTNYALFELFNLKINKHEWYSIEVKKDRTLNVSKDFGNTYY
ncbi:MAG: S-layer homology domain-containing protein [Paenisporosarcina sp.]|nr:S-layer homology domain-containing protein [Paenisporosarcina sp.]